MEPNTPRKPPGAKPRPPAEPAGDEATISDDELERMLQEFHVPESSGPARPEDPVDSEGPPRPRRAPEAIAPRTPAGGNPKPSVEFGSGDMLALSASDVPEPPKRIGA